MSEIIDFTNCKKRFKTYDGASGHKLCIVFNEEQYMLKFPNASKRNKALSYTNSTISEYLGCHILASMGFETQETLLGTYNVNGNKKIVVACKDFTENGKYVFQNFVSMKNTIIDSEHNGTGTELEDIIETINKQSAYNPHELSEYFWNLFIADSLIGNWDRHNGNWGSLYNPQTDEIKLAPVFDCGSSLYPSIDEDMINSVLSKKNEFLFRVYEIPTSAICQNGKRIKYFDFISSLQNEDCNRALKRIYSKLDMKKILKVIDETPFITDLQKTFFATMLTARHSLILTRSYNKLIERDKSLNLKSPDVRKSKSRDDDYDRGR